MCILHMYRSAGNESGLDELESTMQLSSVRPALLAKRKRDAPFFLTGASDITFQSPIYSRLRCSDCSDLRCQVRSRDPVSEGKLGKPLR